MSSHTVLKCMQTIQWAFWQLRSSDTFQPQSYTRTAIDGINTFSAWEPKMTHLTVPEKGKTNHWCYHAYTVEIHIHVPPLTVPHEPGNRIRRIMNGAQAYSISVCHQSGCIQTVHSVGGFITLCASWHIRQKILSCWWPLFSYQTYRCDGQHPDRQR